MWKAVKPSTDCRGLITVTPYKTSRGHYKLVVFTVKYGLETFHLKGKKSLRDKAKALKLLYKDLKENMPIALPKNFRPWKILEGLTVVRAFKTEQERDSAYEKLQRPNKKLIKEYMITVKDME